MRVSGMLLIHFARKSARAIHEIFPTKFVLAVPEGCCSCVSMIRTDCQASALHAHEVQPSLATILHEEEVIYPSLENMTLLSAFNFWGGRVALRQALPELMQPILKHPNGSPRVPTQVQASISHKFPLAAALAARNADFAGLGVDIEIAASRYTSTNRLANRILNCEEMRTLEKLKSIPTGLRPRMCFSLKEAIFKALNPSIGRIRLGDIIVYPRSDGACEVSCTSARTLRIEATWRLIRCPVSVGYPHLYIVTTATAYCMSERCVTVEVRTLSQSTN